MNLVETIDYKNCKIKIYPDDCAEDPREWDNLGKMCCFHKRYTLGDKTKLTSDQFENWQELSDYLITEEKAVVILPLYLYDHGGITMQAGVSFNDPWDSGQVGFVYATKDDVLKEYSCKKITAVVKNKTVKTLFSEVKIYDDYLTGNVYGYAAEDTDGKQIDSCYGYFGDYNKNGMLDDAKSCIDYHIKEETKRKETKLKALIKNNVALEKREELLV